MIHGIGRRVAPLFTLVRSIGNTMPHEFEDPETNRFPPTPRRRVDISVLGPQLKVFTGKKCV
ncbi:hypothetical protein PSCLAVI8L_130714 [Pseudoclavibacter sp. 8L]|nr:hypothetical protein PSCLAVI8L_130714 [Pseudoclavibacter sp. 8L]